MNQEENQPAKTEAPPPELRMWPEDELAKFPNLIASPYTGVGVHNRGPDCDAHGCVAYNADTAAEALELRRRPAGRAELIRRPA